MLISLSPKINSVNDHTGFIVRAAEIRRVGWWARTDKFVPGGYCYGASYAPLATLIMLHLGVDTYMYFAFACYAQMFALLFSGLLTGFVLGLAAMFSPWFKNSAFVAGRHDLAGWPLLVSGLYLAATGSPGWAIAPLAAGMAVHPSCIVVGLASMVFVTPWPVAVAALLQVPWVLPFLTAGPGVAFKWTPGKVVDLTRTWQVHAHKAAGMVLFLITLFWEMKK
jgi:hypothetical protein